MSYLAYIIELLVFPGLVFTAAAGLAATWVDRFVTARVQMRAGPPFLQPFYDIRKYLIKETIVPPGASKGFFLAMPLTGLAAAAAAATMLGHTLFFAPEEGFLGDIIVLLYLLTLPAVAVILGAFASKNPIASIGGSREMKLLMAYELPFVLAVLVPVIQTGGIRLSEILGASSAVCHPSGVIALLVAVLCMQAKLTQVPFDLPEAETELTGGVFVEYSGPPFAMFKLTRAMMFFLMPLFLVAVFWGGMRADPGLFVLLLGILKWLLLVVVIILIKNTAPRVRIDQAVRFFWGPMTLLALAAAGLALVGW